MCYFGPVVGCVRFFLNQRGKKEAKVWADKVRFNSNLAGWILASLQRFVTPHFYLSVLSFINIYVVMIAALILTFEL